MSAYSSPVCDLQKLLKAGKSLYIDRKYAEARLKFGQALRLLEACVDQDDVARDNDFCTPQALHVALADCFCREADEIRTRGVSNTEIKTTSDGNSDDDEGDDHLPSSLRKRRKVAPSPRSSSPSSTLEDYLFRHKDSLQDALMEVDAGLALGVTTSSSTSSTSSARRLLILGAEILMKLAHLGPGLTTEKTLRKQARDMIDKLEAIEETGWVDSGTLRRGLRKPKNRLDTAFERRLWKAMYGVKDRRYAKLVSEHPASALIRDHWGSALFVAKPVIAEEEKEAEDEEARLFDDLSALSRSRRKTSVHSFPSLDDALLFVLPDVFDEALDCEESYRMRTFILFPSPLIVEEEEQAEQQAEEQTEEEQQAEEEAAIDKRGDLVEAEQGEADMEGKMQELCYKYGMSHEVDVKFPSPGGRIDEHVCFFHQRFYQYYSEKQSRKRDFCIQLLLCDLCAFEEDVDAIFYLHGLTPKPLDGTMDLREKLNMNSDKEKDEDDSEDEEKKDELREDQEGELRKDQEGDLEDFGLAGLNLNDDKSVFLELFPAIKSVF